MKFIEHKFAFAFSVAFLALAGTGDDAVGLTPIWGQISDACDTVANIRNVWGHSCDIEAWKGLRLFCVGWIPGFGDAAKSGGKLYKGAGKAAGRVASRICDGWRG
jgi:hypothetical protein